MANEHTYDIPERNEGKDFAKELRRSHHLLKMLITKCLIVVIVFSVLFGVALLVTIVIFKTKEAANNKQMVSRFNSLEKLLNKSFVQRDGCNKLPKLKEFKEKTYVNAFKPKDGRTTVQYTFIIKQNVDTFEHCPVSVCVEGKGTWSVFNVSKSVVECYTNSSGGAAYNGKNICTATGRTCQKWNRDFPHRRYFIPKNIADLNSNYCRDIGPPFEHKPWCYTTDPEVRWEMCHVPLC